MGQRRSAAGRGNGSDVTRWLCLSLYERLPPALAVRPATRRHGRHARTGYTLTDRPRLPGGETAAAWLVDEVLRSPRGPVPSYGFDLIPVLAHALWVRRLRVIRRAGTLAVLALVVTLFPQASALWAAVLLTAWPLGPAGRGLPVLTALVCLIAIPTRPDAVWPAQMLLAGAAAGLGLYGVHLLDHALARSLARTLRDAPDPRPPLPPLTTAQRRLLAAVDAAQHDTELPYDAGGRFIGAGGEARAVGDLRVSLRPRYGAPLVRPLDGAELLGHMAAALGVGHEDGSGPGHRPPGFSVTEVRARPVEVWRGPRGTATGLRGRGAERPCLRVQYASADGQVVVTVVLHAARRGDQLRLTLYPQVLTPLHPLLDPALPRRSVAVTAALGLRELSRILVRRPGDGPDGVLPGTGPSSLREAYSLPGEGGRYRRADADRLILLTHTRALAAVERLLEERGFVTEEFHEAARAVVTRVGISGGIPG
ncbi:hypothetical protein ACFVIM_32695 [Streptomyces sp. NPDC057638]|uniref:hypothetical protein n=1 Tax=Streptomyces sp. NPDC057638 TaxID=3346190 RepID=UPI003685A0E6